MKFPQIRVEVLGSGTSVGVPSIGCKCGVCLSTDERDKRLRCSVLLSWNGHNVVIDTTPDFRTQALRAGLDRLDAVLYTHAHTDHILGMDDIRPFNFRQRAPVPIYAAEDVLDRLQKCFHYVFDAPRQVGGGIPKVEVHVLTDEPFELCGLTVTPIPLMHGGDRIYGFRVGGVAYLTDHSEIPASSEKLLHGLDVLFLDALRHKFHPTHSTVQQSLESAAALRPRRAYFTHICHDLGHVETEEKFPARVAVSYDGLTLSVDGPRLKVWTSLDALPRNFGPCVLTIGNFDGVHKGHRELMRRVVRKAEGNAWNPAVMTFDPHPAKLVAPERSPLLLTSPDERCRLMETEGIEQVFILPFDTVIAALAPEDFVERILVRQLDARSIIVGEDFRFGRKQAGNVEMLRTLGERFGFSVEAIRKIDSHHHSISSTEIRRRVLRGEVSEAWHMLAAPYTLEGRVVRGLGVGSKQTVPTLNLETAAEIPPRDGVYVTRTRDIHSERVWTSITNIGVRPTFDGEGRTIETFLLDALEGHAPHGIRVEFLYRLRDERKFADAQALRAQIMRDVARAQAWHRRYAKWVRTAHIPDDRVG